MNTTKKKASPDFLETPQKWNGKTKIVENILPKCKKQKKLLQKEKNSQNTHTHTHFCNKKKNFHHLLMLKTYIQLRFFIQQKKGMENCQKKKKMKKRK